MTREAIIAVLIAIAVILVAFAVAGMWRAKRKRIAAERARREALLGSASALRSHEDQRRRTRGKAQLSLSFTGTFSAGVAPEMLEILDRGGCADVVGPILLNEPDVNSRQVCLADLPAAFRERVTAAHYPILGGGGGARSIEEMEELREAWFHDLQRGTTAWLQDIDRTRATLGVGPVLHVAFVSPGGSLALSEHPISRYHEQFPTVPTYVLTILDQKTPVRQRFEEVHRLLDGKQQRIRGTILCDNAIGQKRNDFAVMHFLAAMTAGTWLTTKQLGT